MIIDSLYPTDDTISVGNDPNPLTTAITDYWGSTDGSITVNSPGSYWLGYISKDNLPGMYHTNIIYLNDDDPDDKKIVIKDLTDDDNFPCTYIKRGIDYSSYLYTESFHTEYDGVVSDLVGSPYKRYLFNQNYAEYSGFLYNNNSYQRSTTASINILCYIYDHQDQRIYPSEYPITGQLWQSIFYASGSTYIDDIYKFLYLGDEYTFSIRFPYSGAWYTYDFIIKAEDLTNGTGIIWDTNNQVQLRFFIYGFDFGTGGALRDGGAIPFGPSFMAKVTGHDAEHTISVLRDGHGSDGYSNKIDFVNNFYWGTPARYENPVFTYGYKEDVEFDYSAVNGVSHSNNVPYIYTDSAICFSYDGRQWFLPYYNMDDVKKAFSLFYRVCRSNVDSYVSGVSYATDVAPDNQFMAQLKTGNITDPTFKNSLREWQYDEFTDNDFTEDDVPHPSPGPGPRPDPVDPGDDENGGDDIILPSIDGLGGGFGFTTQYALRGSQLQELGAALWAGFDTNNPDIDAYIRNFIYSVDPDTGSVNMADIMSFFISLRAYPIALGNLSSITPAGTDLYIGAGTAPLRKTDGTTPFTSPLHTLDSYLEEVDAGSVTLPFWYGDYRDYNTEIICYLPYCGTAQLNPGDVLGGTLTVTYVVDLSTGSCTAYVMCDTWDGKHYPVAVLPGQMGVDIPITATNAGRVGARLLGDRINVAENIMSVLKSGITGIGAIMSGNYAGALRSGVQAFIDPAINEQKLLAGMAERGAIAAPMLSGGRGLAAFKNPMTAYVQIRSPFYTVPDNYADTVGDSAAVSVQIGSCSGFCQFYNVDVSGVTADADDQNAIRAALESGVII